MQNNPYRNTGPPGRKPICRNWKEGICMNDNCSFTHPFTHPFYIYTTPTSDIHPDELRLGISNDPSLREEADRIFIGNFMQEYLSTNREGVKQRNSQREREGFMRRCRNFYEHISRPFNPDFVYREIHRLKSELYGRRGYERDSYNRESYKGEGYNRDSYRGESYNRLDNRGGYNKPSYRDNKPNYGDNYNKPNYRDNYTKESFNRDNNPSYNKPNYNKPNNNSNYNNLNSNNNLNYNNNLNTYSNSFPSGGRDRKFNENGEGSNSPEYSEFNVPFK